jgi:ATP-binding cassette subfamily B protein
MSTPSNYSDIGLYRRLLLLARPYWLHITAFFLISLLSTPLALLAPLPMKIAVDSGISSNPRGLGFCCHQTLSIQKQRC